MSPRRGWWSRAWWLLAAPAAVAAALASPPGCALYPELTRTSRATTPAARDCAACHVEQAREWRASAHARAFVAEAFVEATDGHRFGECIGCHAPGSLFEATTGPPRPRLDRLADGVDCQACHLDRGALVGPVHGGALVRPHPVRVDHDLHGRPELCGRCHEGTLAEARALAPGDARTCQGCHMAPVTRTVTAATDRASALLVALEDPVPQRRHTFDVTAVDLTDAFDLRIAVARAGDAVEAEVTVVSRVPHLVPTGDFGFRQGDVIVEGRDAAGASTGRIARALHKELGTALRPGEPLVVRGSLPPATTRVEVTLGRAGRDGERPALLARAEARVP
ncbi:MAG: cytochrome c family protein [Planctomycetes bacterium]|nr:cytochrome c family protein [Planctomycetota bacterium]